MTTGWIIANIALAVAVTTLVAGLAVLIPLNLDRRSKVPALRKVVGLGPNAVQRSDSRHDRRAA
ncbi:MAG: hypothetical protein JF887_01985 [Candidatus Dormibacteraeota bacterium]|uniref:Uncharacterized protein n=1 Tax=Candidatus Amunia macphersoniae TaxID=3127014 RepID=A0A934KER9_9BACT|nr:hypothetical protein [Candidatus Dormibacteraeota bacterium]